MAYLKRIFKFYSIEYFIKSYGVALFLAFLYLLGREHKGALFSTDNIGKLLFVVFSTLLYPFAKATYLYIKQLFIPEGTIYINFVIILLLAKLFMAMILYVFSIPLGIINVAIVMIKLKIFNNM